MSAYPDHTMELSAVRLDTVASVGVLAGWMLHPECANWRLKIRAKYQLEDWRRRFSMLGSDDLEKVPSDIWAQILAIESVAATDAEMEEAFAVDKSLERGLAAGYILHTAVLRTALGAPRPVTSATRQAAAALSGRGHTASRHVNTVVMKRFRAVSHLWAAWFDDHDADPNICWGEFPCKPDGVSTFLARAEGFRRLAEETVPPRRGEPILRPGTAVRIPDAVAVLLPEGSLVVRRRGLH